MITRSFTSSQLDFRHTPPGIVRALGTITSLVNGAMAFAGLMLVGRGQLFGVALLMLGGLGLAFGITMIFGAHAQRIDRTSIRQTWSLFVPVYTRVTNVADVEALLLTRTYRRVKYSVVIIEQLFAVGEGTRIALLQSGTPEFPSDIEAISRFLGLPVRDEREKDTRKMVRDTQMKALPVAIAIALVMICVLSVGALTILVIERGPGEDSLREPPPTITDETEQNEAARPRRANRTRRRSVSAP